MNGKKYFRYLFALSALCAGILPAYSGGLLHNTNQHITFDRMMARGASTEIDAVFTNPAGTGLMDHDGWTLSFNFQSAYQTRDVEATFPMFLTPDHKEYYKGKATAPVVPDVYAVYKKGPLALSAFFGIIGGGGKCSFDRGLPNFDAAVMAGVAATTRQMFAPLAPAMPELGSDFYVTPDMYSITSAMKGRQFVYGGQLGAAYRVGSHWSFYGGLRIDYFSGNYKGFVRATANTKLLSIAEQVAIRVPSVAPTIATMAGEGGIANIALDCNQSGWGVTPILGVNFRWRALTLAAKYEFKTSLNIENDTKQLDVAPAAFAGALSEYQDGVNTPNDLPAVLYVAAGCEFIPKKFRGTLEYHFYDDKHARMAGNKQKSLRHGTHEILAGLEWDINKRFTVSCGFQNTDYGLSDDYQTHTSFSCDSYSIGFGGAVNINEHVRLNLGYFWTTYKDYTRNSTNYCGTGLPGTDVFSRTNKVIGLGVDWKF